MMDRIDRHGSHKDAKRITSFGEVLMKRSMCHCIDRCDDIVWHDT